MSVAGTITVHTDAHRQERLTTMTGVRIYDPARSSRVYVHTDPRTGLLPAPAAPTIPAPTH